MKTERQYKAKSFWRLISMERSLSAPEISLVWEQPNKNCAILRKRNRTLTEFLSRQHEDSNYVSAIRHRVACLNLQDFPGYNERPLRVRQIVLRADDAGRASDEEAAREIPDCARPSAHIPAWRILENGCH